MNNVTCVSNVFFLSIALKANAQLVEQATTKIAELNDLIEMAEGKGIDARKEKMTIRVAEMFLDFADWDETHQVENIDYFDLVPIYRDSSEAMATLLPNFERSEVIQSTKQSYFIYDYDIFE